MTICECCTGPSKLIVVGQLNLFLKTYNLPQTTRCAKYFYNLKGFSE